MAGTIARLEETDEKWGAAQEWEMAAGRKESQCGREIFGI